MAPVFPETFPSDSKFKDVENMMKEHKGRLIRVKSGNRYFRITGVSRKPLGKLRFRKKSMTEYYKKRYNMDLQYLNYPVFNCTNSVKIPPEVASLEDENTDEILDAVAEYLGKENCGLLVQQGQDFQLPYETCNDFASKSGIDYIGEQEDFEPFEIPVKRQRFH
jgi:hypothetical protein